MIQGPISNQTTRPLIANLSARLHCNVRVEEHVLIGLLFAAVAVDSSQYNPPTLRGRGN
jgi:hypothetical protein